MHNEKGFISIPLIIVVLVAVSLTSTVIPVKRNYNDGKSFVQGIESTSPSETPEVHQEKTESKPEVETHSTVNTVRNDIREGKLQIQFESKDDKVHVQTKVKNEKKETELEAEAEHNAVNEMNTELEKEDIRISTSSGKLAIMNKRAGALSTFPLSVNPTTKELTVTTPSGSKTVTILPQAAIDNMKAAHIMDTLTSENTTEGLGSAQDLVQLQEQDGVLGYQMKGTKTHKFLGIIPVTTNVSAFVSAENGQVVSSTESLLGRILGKIGS